MLRTSGGFSSLDYGVSPHQYPDATQSLLHGPASSAVQMVEHILTTASVLDEWLSSNRLRLNPEKCQLIWLGGCLQLSHIDLE